MSVVDDYVARIEGTCGEEKDVIVIFKYDTKEKAVKKILEKAKLRKSIANMIFELTFKNVSFRVYTSGKAIFRGLKSKDELRDLLSELLQ
jgi:ribonuclease HIII